MPGAKPSRLPLPARKSALAWRRPKRKLSRPRYEQSRVALELLSIADSYAYKSRLIADRPRMCNRRESPPICLSCQFNCPGRFILATKSYHLRAFHAFRFRAFSVNPSDGLPLTSYHFVTLCLPPYPKVTDLEARAGTHTAELSSVTQEAAALREDASVAARRSDEARRHLAALQKETAQLSSQTEAMRASKRSLTSELAGLRHELATLREGVTKRGQGGDARLDISTGTVTAGVGLQDSESLFPYARRSHQEAFRRVGDDDGGVAYSRKAIGGAFERPSSRGHVDDARVVESSSEGGNLVEIVADFQGRLRRQVQAALAEGSLSAGCKQTADRSPFTRGAVELNLEDSKTAENRTTFLKADQKDGVFSGRGGGRRDVLGELEKRVGSV